jgi:hypothetical protein
MSGGRPEVDYHRPPDETGQRNSIAAEVFEDEILRKVAHFVTVGRARTCRLAPRDKTKQYDTDEKDDREFI